MSSLEIKNLHVSVEDKEILKGVNLTLNKGEIHALMGPNGSGKTTLCFAIMGHPNYRVTQGNILLNGEDITHLSPTERAKKGIFLAFQSPPEIEGLKLNSFLWHAYNSVNGANFDKGEEIVSLEKFKKIADEKAKSLSLKKTFLERNVNEGFSGGERKKSEILQLLVLQPQFALLDEIDSGLDVDALKRVTNAIHKYSKNIGIMLVTHYKRILSYIKPTCVHVMLDGKIFKTGDISLVEEIEKKGYNSFTKNSSY
ncbi:MAG: Fe-S cluster assembly ATPase SufC [Candidatus Aenigmarchaeota archaeon]|nr:Fe-S cluster assembly ATPase SufC [Candidatus Aenigmarchaeota archaeon]